MVEPRGGLGFEATPPHLGGRRELPGGNHLPRQCLFWFQLIQTRYERNVTAWIRHFGSDTRSSDFLCPAGEGIWESSHVGCHRHQLNAANRWRSSSSMSSGRWTIFASSLRTDSP